MEGLTKYKNYEEIAAVERQIKEISPELKISGTASNDLGKTASAVYVIIFEKGNKTIISKLKEIGFEKTYRCKIGDSFDGYSMRVTLRKFL